MQSWNSIVNARKYQSLYARDFHQPSTTQDDITAHQSSTIAMESNQFGDGKQHSNNHVHYMDSLMNTNDYNNNCCDQEMATNNNNGHFNTNTILHSFVPMPAIPAMPAPPVFSEFQSHNVNNYVIPMVDIPPMAQQTNSNNNNVTSDRCARISAYDYPPMMMSDNNHDFMPNLYYTPTFTDDTLPDPRMSSSQSLDSSTSLSTFCSNNHRNLSNAHVMGYNNGFAHPYQEFPKLEQESMPNKDNQSCSTMYYDGQPSPISTKTSSSSISQVSPMLQPADFRLDHHCDSRNTFPPSVRSCHAVSSEQKSTTLGTVIPSEFVAVKGNGKSGELKPFVCVECGRRYKYKSSLKLHSKIHGDDAAVCPECGKKFAHPHKLKIHRRSHTGERPYPCEYCGKAFSDRSNRKRHIRIHTGEKPYECEFCKKRYSDSSALVDHRRRKHTKEKPYQCTWNGCGKRFAASSDLTSHLAVHAEVRPFSCDVCNKSFKRRSDVHKHMAVHNKKARKKVIKKNY